LTVPHAQRGVALIAALFLLVVLAALAAYMVTISGAQQQTPSLAADASRAWYAARAGIEGVAAQAESGGACPGATTNYTLDGFNVQVTCSATNHTERGESFQVFALESKASRGTYGGLNFVSRTVRATVTTAP
jgi:MSHA biogenesis protein MshP